jgi:hypothetical protein
MCGETCSTKVNCWVCFLTVFEHLFQVREQVVKKVTGFLFRLIYDVDMNLSLLVARFDHRLSFLEDVYFFPSVAFVSGKVLPHTFIVFMQFYQLFVEFLVSSPDFISFFAFIVAYIFYDFRLLFNFDSLFRKLKALCKGLFVFRGRTVDITYSHYIRVLTLVSFWGLNLLFFLGFLE